MHFMLETIIAADLLGVDAFDQPAVEGGQGAGAAISRGDGQAGGSFMSADADCQQTWPNITHRFPDEVAVALPAEIPTSPSAALLGWRLVEQDAAKG